jgi:hypothetical protein
MHLVVNREIGAAVPASQKARRIVAPGAEAADERFSAYTMQEEREGAGPGETEAFGGDVELS